MEKVYCKHCKYCVRLNTYAERYGCSHPKNLFHISISYEHIVEPRRIEKCNPDNACILYKETFWRRLWNGKLFTSRKKEDKL